jgi:translation elongation factor EF-G
MRARGASVTDVVIIVVAADDGVKPQTEEVISHAKASGCPIIVAVNKMDKETANMDMVKSQMAEREMTPVDWGGDVEFIGVSAHTGMGIDDLLENIFDGFAFNLKQEDKTALSPVASDDNDNTKILNTPITTGSSIIYPYSNKNTGEVEFEHHEILKTEPVTNLEIENASRNSFSRTKSEIMEDEVLQIIRNSMQNRNENQLSSYQNNKNETNILNNDSFLGNSLKVILNSIPMIKNL